MNLLANNPGQVNTPNVVMVTGLLKRRASTPIFLIIPCFGAAKKDSSLTGEKANYTIQLLNSTIEFNSLAARLEQD